MVRPGRARIGGELGQAGKRQVDLAAGAFDAELPDGGDEFRIEIALLQRAAEK